MRLSNDPSVFDIVNLFRLHWFLNRDWLLSFVASAQRSESGRIEWVEFLPDGHIHLVRSAFKLVPPSPSVPAAKIKRCMFAFIIKFLNRERLYADFFAPSPPWKVRSHTDSTPPPLFPMGTTACAALARAMGQNATPLAGLVATRDLLRVPFTFRLPPPRTPPSSMPRT